MKAIVVTGGAGFIGSHTSLSLLEKGYNVFIIDSFVNSSKEIIDKIKDFHQSNKKKFNNNFFFYENDLKDFDALDNIFLKIIKMKFNIEAVFHFAGYKSASKSLEVPLEYWDNNFSMTINLIKIMSRYECNKIVFSSSAIVYGANDNYPLKEESNLNPANPYGNTKYAIERFLYDLSNSDDSNLKVICLRYFNPIGAHEKGLIGELGNDISENLFPIICDVAAKKRKELVIFGNDWPTKDGTCIRDYIHIMDLVDAHLDALIYLNKNDDKFLILNIGTGCGVSVIDLVKTFERVNNISIKFIMGKRRKGDIAISYASPELARLKIKWKSKRDLDKMCIDGWRWYKKINHLV